MTYSSFIQEYQGRRIDFDHSGFYLASDLVREYAFNIYKIGFEIPSFPELWASPPSELIDYYYQTNDVTVKEGDIIILRDNHGGIASGEQTPERFVLLEQNAVGSRTGIGDDAIRENWYDKNIITGIYRARFSPDTVVESLAPTISAEIDSIEEVPPVTPKPVTKPYKHPTGALRVPFNRVEFKIITEINCYSYVKFAQSGDRPIEKLKPGIYYMIEQRDGMARIDKGEGTPSCWINPADNIIKQFNSAFSQDPRHGFTWYGANTMEECRPIKYKADGDYVKRNRKADVLSFNPAKPNASINYLQEVWIAGTCVVSNTNGDVMYGVPANDNKNGTYSVMKSYSIPMTYLSLGQMDYNIDNDDLIHDVEPVEAESMIPVRTVTIKDNVTLVKAHGQKLLDGFIRRS